MRVIFLVLLTSVIGGSPTAITFAEQQPTSACPVSPRVNSAAPYDSGADPLASDWYINADQTIWAGTVPPGGWSRGGTTYNDGRQIPGHKTYWVRPAGLQLSITGRRLDDATAPAVEAFIPCCYRSGFQIVSLHFPTEGCWEVSARAGDHVLQFVTRVAPDSKDRE